MSTGAAWEAVYPVMMMATALGNTLVIITGAHGSKY